MKVHFWGTRGSIPSSFCTQMLREKLFVAIQQAQNKQFLSEEAIRLFIENELDSSVSHACGTNTLCVQIETAETDEYLLCDAGTGIVRFANALKQSKKPITGNTFHIFISHLHWDHIQGFPFFALSFPKGNRIIIHGYHEKIEAIFHSMMTPPVFPVSFKDISSQIVFDIQKPQTPFYVNDISVSSILQNHPGLSYGYRFDGKGKSIVYSTDCEHHKGERNQDHPFVRFYKDADLVIFDAMSSLSEEQQIGWGHSTYKIGLELCALAQAKKLAFIHHDPEKSDAHLWDLIPLSNKYQKNYYEKNQQTLDTTIVTETILAYDGLSINI